MLINRLHRTTIKQQVVVSLTPFNINVQSSTHKAAVIDPWSDGAFPAYTYPAPLWSSGNSPIWINVTFSSAGTWTVKADMGTNSNIGTTAMYNQDTDTSTSSPAGSLNTGVNANSGGPGGLSQANLGTVTVSQAGTRRLWFALSGSSYYTMKTLYFS